MKKNDRKPRSLVSCTDAGRAGAGEGGRKKQEHPRGKLPARKEIDDALRLRHTPEL